MRLGQSIGCFYLSSLSLSTNVTVNVSLDKIFHESSEVTISISFKYFIKNPSTFRPSQRFPNTRTNRDYQIKTRRTCVIYMVAHHII